MGARSLPLPVPYQFRLVRFRNIRETRGAIHVGNLRAERALALAASSSRFLGGAFVSSAFSRFLETAAISSTAARNATSFPLEGLLKPLSFLTNCSEAARISSSFTGGSKLKSVLMFLHINVVLIFPRAPRAFFTLTYGLIERG